jgi:hypothetical protein
MPQGSSQDRRHVSTQHTEARYTSISLDSDDTAQHVLQFNWRVVAISGITTEYELSPSVNGGCHANDTMSDCGAGSSIQQDVSQTNRRFSEWFDEDGLPTADRRVHAPPVSVKSHRESAAKQIFESVDEAR